MRREDVKIRKSEDRGRASHGWLESRHTFSFADYHDPRHLGFRSLLVINEDRVQPGQGFGSHAHRDMEIVTWVLDGSLEHKDSLGNGSVIRPGDAQRMSAGTGIVHSEYNPSRTGEVHFLQIWIAPEAKGLAPAYEQRHFAPEERRNQLCLLASRDGREGSIRIHQDTEIRATLLEPGMRVEHALRAGRGAWAQVARGALRLNGAELAAGDGASFESTATLSFEALEPAEIVLFDLA